jgi:serine/threonine-protein kinase
MSEAWPGGEYTVLGKLGRGGMGEVLKVWDNDLGRPMAMKVMRVCPGPSGGAAGASPRSDPLSLSRFLEEAQITGQLDHPGIVPVHEAGVDPQGQVFFTMRLVEGEDLAAVFAKARSGEEGWTRTRALGVLVKVCEALAYAHAKGVIHRDLKPSNIRVGSFGETYVIDWGLAKLVGRDDARVLRASTGRGAAPSALRALSSQDAGDDPGSPVATAEGSVVGTPAYFPRGGGRPPPHRPPGGVLPLLGAR